MSHISVGLREILQTILIHVVEDAKPLEYFHTLFHHHALPSVTTSLAMTCSIFHQHALPPWTIELIPIDTLSERIKGKGEGGVTCERYLVRLGASFEENLHHSLVAIKGGPVQRGLREILQTILIHVVKDAKPLEYFHTLFHHHALPSVLYHDSDFGDSKLI